MTTPPTAGRILLCGPVPPQPGGGPISRGQLAAGFARHGRTVGVVAPILAGMEDDDWYARENPELRIERYTVPKYDSLTLTPMDPQSARWEQALVQPCFERMVDQLQPDLVVIGRETYARYVTHLARSRGLPSVLLVRGNPVSQMIRGEYPQSETDFLLERFHEVDRIIAVADYLAQGLRRLGVSQVTSIDNAIEVDRFRPGPRDEELLARLGVPRGKRVVLVPGALNARKRSLDVVDAAASILKTHEDVVFVMAGIGGGRAAVSERIEALGVAGRVLLPGWVHYHDMPRLMSSADAVVMASSNEGMSRVYIEAMASGRPLIVSDIDAAREIVEDGTTGLLYPLADVEGLAKRVAEVLDDPARARRIGGRAHAAVQHRHIDEVIPRYLAEFDGVVAIASVPARTAPAAAPALEPTRPSFARRIAGR